MEEVKVKNEAPEGNNSSASASRKRKPNQNNSNKNNRQRNNNRSNNNSSNNGKNGNNTNNNKQNTNSNGKNGNNNNSRRQNNNSRRRNNNKKKNSEALKMDVDERPTGTENSNENVNQATGNQNSKQIHMTEKRFADLEEVCDESRRALAETFKYEFMTEVQAQTLPVILDSQRNIDVLAKAKTGTGKTLGFLIPAVEKLLVTNKNGKNGIGCLVISPTRELAFQISKEGEKLVCFQKNPRINILACVGGTNINKDRNVLKQGRVNILVATPGRLLDHLQNQELDLTGQLANLEVLALDEADQLLDMGFRPDIERVLRLLQPSQEKRQTLLFSATVPKSVSEIASIALKTKYEYIDTVGEDEEQTHAHVKQEVMVAPSSVETEGMGDKQIRAIASILDREVKASSKAKPCKVMVFFTTARLTGFMAELFNAVSNRTGFPKILEIHSRKSQSIRQKASERFRTSKDNAIMFSSDVSARGMDYPGVTFVLQVGLTERAQYIHRLGRTARAGSDGRGAILLAPYECQSMTRKVLSDMPLEPTDVPNIDSKMNQAMDAALEKVCSDKNLTESAEQAYRAWLGYYNGNLKKVGWDKKCLVQEANQWAKDIGLQHQPSLLRRTVGKMGLKHTPGLKLE